MKRKILLITVAILFLQSCEFNVSTAYISDVRVCTRVDANICSEDEGSFSIKAKEIFATAKLNNAMEGVQITISWQFDNNGEWYVIDQVKLNYDGVGDEIKSSVSSPTNGWPLGDYRVVFSLDTDDFKPIIKDFIIR